MIKFGAAVVLAAGAYVVGDAMGFHDGHAKGYEQGYEEGKVIGACRVAVAVRKSRIARAAARASQNGTDAQKAEGSAYNG